MTDAPGFKADDQSVVAKTFLRGTHRTLSPDQTIARVAQLLPRFGVTRVANLTGLDRR